MTGANNEKGSIKPPCSSLVHSVISDHFMMVLAHHRISEEALFSRSLASVIPETHRAQ
jgi:hypothetical protein